MVAEVKRPEITAREEASTVIGDPIKGDVVVPFGGDGAGVGYALSIALLIALLLSMLMVWKKLSREVLGG